MNVDDSKYWRPFIKEGAETFIKNVKTKPLLLKIDDLCLPITVNSNAQYE